MRLKKIGGILPPPPAHVVGGTSDPVCAETRIEDPLVAIRNFNDKKIISIISPVHYLFNYDDHIMFIIIMLGCSCPVYKLDGFSILLCVYLSVFQANLLKTRSLLNRKVYRDFLGVSGRKTFCINKGQFPIILENVSGFIWVM